MNIKDIETAARLANPSATAELLEADQVVVAFGTERVGTFYELNPGQWWFSLQTREQAEDGEGDDLFRLLVTEPSFVTALVAQINTWPETV